MHEDAIYIAIGIEAVNEGKQFTGGDGSRLQDGLAMDAEGLRSFRLIADVDFGSGVIARENDGEAGGAMVEGAECVDAGAAFAEDFVAGTVAVEKEGHQTNLADGVAEIGRAHV